MKLALVRWQVRAPASRTLAASYRFCPAAGCDLVYFADDGSAIVARELRRPPAYKTGDSSGLLCYCFDATGSRLRDEAAADTSATLAYIRQRVRDGDCACDVMNPSGGCCLGSITAWLRPSRPPR